MAEKRTKADKEQRQADQLDKKSERRPEQVVSKEKYARTLAEPLNSTSNPAQETWTTWDKNPLK